MKRITKRVFLGAALALTPAFAATAQVFNVTGSYLVEGRNPDGSIYTGTAVVAQQGDAVQINWTVENQTHAGSGIRDGQVVVVDWGQPDPVVYVVMENGEMHGTWSRGRALEKLVPQ